MQELLTLTAFVTWLGLLPAMLISARTLKDATKYAGAWLTLSVLSGLIAAAIIGVRHLL
jgi:membrane protein implicated in regulation of membrane protease activity